MSIPESKIAKLPSGALLSYMDSGEGGTKTYVFVHGASLNKHCWDHQYLHLPAVIRAISYSERGYDKSTPFSDADKNKTSLGSDLLKQHATDLSQFLDFVEKDLGVSGPVTLVTWSQGGIIPIAAAYFGLPLKNVNNIILFEPPTTACWGMAPDPAGLKLAWANPEVTPDTLPRIFATYVAGFYDHPKEFFTKRDVAMESDTIVDSTLTDPAMGPSLGKCIEATHMDAIFHGHFAESKAAAAAQGAKELNGYVAKVGVIYGDKFVPECILGSWVAEDAFKGKVNTVVIPGGNHFLHMQKPEEFWRAVQQLS